MNRFARTALPFTLCAVLVPALARAQTRTWVSGVGDDANPCSRTAPCKTFAGAISKTAAGGEISVLDPGGFGAVTITKSITLNGDGTLASILGSGTNAININSASAIVTLRNLSLNGAGTGLTGINVMASAAVIVDHVTISGFHAALATQATNTGNVTMIDSTITQNSDFGIHAIGGSISVENSTLTNNGVAVQAETGTTIRLSNNAVYNNLTGFGCGSGTLASAGNNRKGNNAGGGGPACAPNAAVTLQ